MRSLSPTFVRLGHDSLKLAPVFAADLSIRPFHDTLKTGRFLVSAGNEYCVVAPLVGDVISFARTLEGRPWIELVREANSRGMSEAELSRLLEALPASIFSGARNTAIDAARRLFLLHRTLVPAQVAIAVGSFFAPLIATWLAIAVSLVAAPLSILLVLNGMPPTITWQELALTYVLVFVGLLAHEFGHAAALHRFGGTSGRIGIGVYLIFPVLFTDVSHAWGLTVRQRAVVDLAGMYFQTILLTISVPVALATKNSVAVYFSLTTLVIIAQNLNPFVKFDGYWFLSDVTGLTNLHQRARRIFTEWPNLDRVRRLWLGAYAASFLVWAVAAITGLVTFVRFLMGFIYNFAQALTAVVTHEGFQRNQALANMFAMFRVSEAWFGLIVIVALLLRLIISLRRRFASAD